MAAWARHPAGYTPRWQRIRRRGRVHPSLFARGGPGSRQTPRVDPHPPAREPGHPSCPRPGCRSSGAFFKQPQVRPGCAGDRAGHRCDARGGSSRVKSRPVHCFHPRHAEPPDTGPFLREPGVSSYVNQPAVVLIGSAEAHQLATGAGIVAVIDTGVDPNHPVLKASLVPGFDFTRNLPGMPSEFADLGQSTASILDQSTASILDQQTILILNQSTASILDQSTASILDTRLVPQEFGHGTMVAGIIHLVAPAAQIMPLKAFEADGTAHLFDILRAIYYAVDHGAKVINMSFSTEQGSAGMGRAMNYAVSRGVICVSSAGNNGARLRVYPAAFGNVLGVGSTSNLDARSTFSNFGDDDVTLAAPGEGIITTHPGGHYAAAWGTSFSASFVSGGAALLLQVNIRTNQETVADALEENAKELPDRLGLGEGRIDLYRALLSAIRRQTED